MAGQLINLTGKPTTTNSSLYQPGSEAFDLLGTAGNRYDFSVRTFYADLSGSGTPSVTVLLQTSMYNDIEDSKWQTLSGANVTVTSSNKVDVISFDSGVLRYLRWAITPTSGTTINALTFEILGVAW